MNPHDMDPPPGHPDFGDGPPYPEKRYPANVPASEVELADELTTVMQRFTGDVSRPDIAAALIECANMFTQMEDVPLRIGIILPDDFPDCERDPGIVIEMGDDPDTAALATLDHDEHPGPKTKVVDMGEITRVLREAAEHDALAPTDKDTDWGHAE